MGRLYKVGRYKLTAMQNATYVCLQQNTGLKSIDEIANFLYSDSIAGKIPDVWTYTEKVANVSKWCNALVCMQLISTHNEKYIYIK